MNIKNKPLEIPKDTKISPQVEDVLRKMLIMDPNKRISWEDLFNHEGTCYNNQSRPHDRGQNQKGLRAINKRQRKYRFQYVSLPFENQSSCW